MLESIYYMRCYASPHRGMNDMAESLWRQLGWPRCNRRKEPPDWVDTDLSLVADFDPLVPESSMGFI
jgi:hypothetical protein